MNLRGLAFILACLTVCLLWAAFNFVADRADKSGQVWVCTSDYMDPVADQKVKAIESLNLPNTTVVKIVVSKYSAGNLVWEILGTTALCAIITGLVSFFYKLYCRWLGATPDL